MGYTDSLLADGEIVARRARQHWLALLPEARRAWVLLIVGVVALAVGLYVANRASPWPTIGSGLSLVALVALLLGIADAAYHVVRWRAQDFVVTNRRVVLVEGILNKRAADASLEKINDAILSQGVLGRILRYGDLEILTASESAIDRFRMLSEAAAFKREMLNQKHALELEVGRSPAAPFRAEAPWRGDAPLRTEPTFAASSSAGRDAASRPAPAAAVAGVSGRDWTPEPGESMAARGASAISVGAAASAASVATAPRPMHGDPEQITATLARLADLRDRDAVTPEEYEAKKAELLARL